MHEIFINIYEKGMHEKEYILQLLPSLKILGYSYVIKISYNTLLLRNYRGNSSEDVKSAINFQQMSIFHDKVDRFVLTLSVQECIFIFILLMICRIYTAVEIRAGI